MQCVDIGHMLQDDVSSSECEVFKNVFNMYECGDSGCNTEVSHLEVHREFVLR